MIERFFVGFARSSNSQPLAVRSENSGGSSGFGGGVVRLAGFGTEKLSCTMSKYDRVAYSLSPQSFARTPNSFCLELVSGGLVFAGELDGALADDCSEYE